MSIFAPTLKTYCSIYVADARPRWMGPKMLNGIAEEARANNAISGMRGTLLFAEGRFVQVLQGETVQVLELVGKISADRRCENLRSLWQRQLPENLFPKWTMACFNVSDLEGGHLLRAVPSENNLEGWVADLLSHLTELYETRYADGVVAGFARMHDSTGEG